jgi:hypothetical protein
VAVYDCLLKDLKAAYAKSGNKFAKEFTEWRRYSTRPYVSATHGGRYVQNYGNEAAKAYGNYEKAGEMPEGAVLAKPSFTVSAKTGRASLGPLFLMEKMGEGWHPKADDWRYTMIMPNGQTVGTTKGEGSGNVEFCIQCHKLGTPDDVDSIMFLPEDLRVR